MTKITWKPGTMLSPVPPAMITCGTLEKPNVMTAAWTGIISSEPPMTYVSIRPERYSHEIIKENMEFVINLTTLPLVSAADFCGVKSGRNIDKFKEMKLTPIASSEVAAPQIEESPISIECKVKEIRSFGTHDMFLAEIVAVNIDDQFLNSEGRLTIEKMGLVAYAHGHYYTLGRNLGCFGFSVNKARIKLAQKMANVEVEVMPSKKPVVEKATAKFGKETRQWKSKSSSSSRGERSSTGKRPYVKRDDEERRPRREGDSDRPRRDFSDRPRREGDSDRPRRDFSDRPRREGASDRPRRDFSDRPRREGDSDRPRRDFSDRPRREGDSDRPRRDSSDRPRREGASDRPRRDSSDRARRSSSSDKPKRKYESGK